MELIKSETALKQLDQMFAFTEEEAETMSELSKMADKLSQKIATAQERMPNEMVDDGVAAMRLACAAC